MAVGAVAQEEVANAQRAAVAVVVVVMVVVVVVVLVVVVVVVAPAAAAVPTAEMLPSREGAAWEAARPAAMRHHLKSQPSEHPHTCLRLSLTSISALLPLVPRH